MGRHLIAARGEAAKLSLVCKKQQEGCVGRQAVGTMVNDTACSLTRALDQHATLKMQSPRMPSRGDACFLGAQVAAHT